MQPGRGVWGVCAVRPAAPCDSALSPAPNPPALQRILYANVVSIFGTYILSRAQVGVLRGSQRGGRAGNEQRRHAPCYVTSCVCTCMARSSWAARAAGWLGRRKLSCLRTAPWQRAVCVPHAGWISGGACRDG